MQLHNRKPCILDLPHSEQVTLILTLRDRRSTAMVQPVTKSKSKAKKPTIEKLRGKLSAEDIRALLDEFNQEGE